MGGGPTYNTSGAARPTKYTCDATLDDPVSREFVEKSPETANIWPSSNRQTGMYLPPRPNTNTRDPSSQGTACACNLHNKSKPESTRSPVTTPHWGIVPEGMGFGHGEEGAFALSFVCDTAIPEVSCTKCQKLKGVPTKSDAPSRRRHMP